VGVPENCAAIFRNRTNSKMERSPNSSSSPYMTKGTLVLWRKKVNPSISELVRTSYFSLSIEAHPFSWKILEVSHGIHSELGVVHGEVSYRKRTISEYYSGERC
jgi:hypothetical protein